MINPADKTKKINVRLFRKIQKAILAHPKAFSMTDFYGTKGAMQFDPKTMKEPSCGSACCIAGWAVTLGRQESLLHFLYNQIGVSVPSEARKLLGLTDEQASEMFTWTGRRHYMKNVTAQEAAAMIDDFLANPLMFE